MNLPSQDSLEHDDFLKSHGSADIRPIIPPAPKAQRPRLNLNGRKRGNVLYMTRVSHGYTQQQLAMLVGVSVRTINEIESRRSSPSVHTAIAIAQVLNARVEDIFTLRAAWFGRQPALRSHRS